MNKSTLDYFKHYFNQFKICKLFEIKFVDEGGDLDKMTLIRKSGLIEEDIKKVLVARLVDDVKEDIVEQVFSLPSHSLDSIEPEEYTKVFTKGYPLDLFCTEEYSHLKRYNLGEYGLNPIKSDIKSIFTKDKLGDLVIYVGENLYEYKADVWYRECESWAQVGIAYILQITEPVKLVTL